MRANELRVLQGPNGHKMNSGHDQPDHNSIFFFAGGEVILTDWPDKLYSINGENFYTPPVYQRQRLTRWHNTISITAGATTYYQREPRDIEDNTTLFETYANSGDQMQVTATEHYQHAVADAHLIYEAAAELARYTRHVLMTDSYLVIADEVAFKPMAGPRSVNWHFNTPVPSVSLNTGCTSFSAGCVTYQGSAVVRQEVLLPIGFSTSIEDVDWDNDNAAEPDGKLVSLTTQITAGEHLSLLLVEPTSVTIVDFVDSVGSWDLVLDDDATDTCVDRLTFDKTTAQLSFAREGCLEP
jgi:hypothetical protein